MKVRLTHRLFTSFILTCLILFTLFTAAFADYKQNLLAESQKITEEQKRLSEQQALIQKDQKKVKTAAEKKQREDELLLLKRKETLLVIRTRKNQFRLQLDDEMTQFRSQLAEPFSQEERLILYSTLDQYLDQRPFHSKPPKHILFLPALQDLLLPKTSSESDEEHAPVPNTHLSIAAKLGSQQAAIELKLRKEESTGSFHSRSHSDPPFDSTHSRSATHSRRASDIGDSEGSSDSDIHLKIYSDPDSKLHSSQEQALFTPVDPAVLKACTDLKVQYLREFDLKKKAGIQSKMECISLFLYQPEHRKLLTPACTEYIKTLPIASALDLGKALSIQERVLCDGLDKKESCVSNSSNSSASSSSATHNTLPRLEDLLDGDYLPPRFPFGSREVFENDILFSKLNGAFDATTEHMMVMKAASTDHPYLHEVADATVMGNISKRLAYIESDPIFRLKNLNVVKNMNPFIEKKIGTASYSVSKALKSALSGGSYPIEQAQKVRLIENLIKENIGRLEAEMSAGSQINLKVLPEIVKDTNPEICSTYIGNALILSLLKTKLDLGKNHPEGKTFQEAVTHVNRIISKDNQNLAASNQIIHQTAEALLKNNSFTTFMEFDTSPVFKQDVNRMIPGKLFPFLLSFSKNACKVAF